MILSLVWGLALAVQAAGLPPGTSVADSPVSSAANSPVNAAETKLAAQDYAGARAILLPYLSAHPADARALYDLGYTADATGNAAEAEANYRKAVASDPEQFEAHAALGLLLAKAGKPAEAIPELQAAAKLSPKPANPAAQAQASRALARLLEPTDPERASTALVAALRESPETPADTLLAAEIAGREGNADAAADAYGKALAAAPNGSPEQAEASAGLAHLLIAAKRWAEAEPVLRKALKTDPQNPALNAQLAEVLSAEGKQADAVAILQNLHAGKPDDTAIALADLYIQTGAPAKAAPLYAQGLAAHPHDPGLLAAEGDALVRAGENEQALPVLEEATRLDPTNGNAWSSLAFAANQTHRPQLVLDALTMRSKVMPDSPGSYFLMATACDTLHQTKRAAELYRQFLSVAGGAFPEEVWQAKHRLVALAR